MRVIPPITLTIIISTLLLAAVALVYQPVPTHSFSVPTADKFKAQHTPLPVKFVDTSLQWGVTHQHHQSSDHLSALTETLGSGVCVIDVNHDGWADLFFVGGSGHTRHFGKPSWWNKTQGHRLLLNQQGRYFNDITESAGLNQPLHGMACAVADLNNDQYSDLIITGVGKNVMFKNNGDLTFSDVTETAGINTQGWSTGAALGDVNQDGLIDLYITQYIHYKKGATTFERTTGFRTTIPIDFDPTLYDPLPNKLYINQGNFVFKEVSDTMGVANSLGRSLGARWININTDHWLDLLVINDHDTPNQLYINQQGKYFTRSTEQASLFELAGAHDVAINYINCPDAISYLTSRGKGHPPVLLSRTPCLDQASAHSTLLTKHLTFPTKSDAIELGTFQDLAWSANIAHTNRLNITSWGTLIADFNNDGMLDSYTASGSLLPDSDAPFIPQAQPNHLLLMTKNVRGQLQFMTQAIERAASYSSRGVISVDLNNDGRLEIVVTNNNDAAQIFSNQLPTQHWIGLDLQSHYSESELFGATLTAITDTATIQRALLAPQNFLSQGDWRIHLGLGNAKTVYQLTIEWPNKATTHFYNIAANHYYSLKSNRTELQPIAYQRTQMPQFEQGLLTSNSTSNSTSNFKLNPQSLLHIGKILLSHTHQPRAYQDLLQLWQQASTQVREQLLQHIIDTYSHPSDQRNRRLIELTLMKQAMQDTGTNMKLLAIDYFKKIESEKSIAWLIPLLFDSDERVQCAVANTFQFFFNEEEAVIHRKGLAIAPLVKLLYTGSTYTATPSASRTVSSAAAICAAEALGASEHNRALVPLMDIVQQQKNSELTIAAINALGLIRDTAATALLEQRIAEPNSSACIVAASLIALTRINATAAKRRFKSFFAISDQPTKTVHQLNTLHTLLSMPSSIVLSKQQLVSTLKELLGADTGNPTLHDAITETALKAITASESNQFEPYIQKLIEQDNWPAPLKQGAVQAHPLAVLAMIQQGHNKTQFETALFKQPASHIQVIVNQLAELNYSFSPSLLETLFQREDTIQIALDLLKRQSQPDLSVTFGRIMESTGFDAIIPNRLNTLLNLCQVSQLNPPLPSTSLLSRMFALTPHLRLQAIDCYLQASPHQKTASPNSKQSTQTYLTHYNLLSNKLLSFAEKDPSIDSQTYLALLIKSTTHRSTVAQIRLGKQLMNLPKDRLSVALTALAYQDPNPRLINTLWRLLRDQTLNHENRLHAAAILVKLQTQTHAASHADQHVKQHKNPMDNKTIEPADRLVPNDSRNSTKGPTVIEYVYDVFVDQTSPSS